MSTASSSGPTDPIADGTFRASPAYFGDHATVDGHAPGVTTDEASRVRELEQEVRELRRVNEVLKRAATFFGAELDRQYRR